MISARFRNYRVADTRASLRPVEKIESREAIFSKVFAVYCSEKASNDSTRGLYHAHAYSSFVDMHRSDITHIELRKSLS